MNKTLLVIPALMLSLSGSAFAAQTWETESVQTGLAAMDSAPVAKVGVAVRGVRMPALRAPAGAPAFFTNWIASGPAESGVPCFGCVNGAPGDALGIPPPYNYVPSGTAQQYNVAWTDLTYNGSCKLFISVASGKTVIGKESFPLPKITAPGAYDIGINFPVANFSGAAIATGKLVCGGKSSSTYAPVIYQ